ncbi:uncharacterized protein LOC128249837 [Octopus bimaculoides]|uniref:uncharacterized protein LOC128249837 n=1 Tax=Octopus bimaculoides TaxID=37653 RepID=UPI0022E206FD|nr:uncharacterized protein LOC128249837 [Octopus bimaculoides]
MYETSKVSVQHETPLMAFVVFMLLLVSGEATAKNCISLAEHCAGAVNGRIRKEKYCTNKETFVACVEAKSQNCENFLKFFMKTCKVMKVQKRSPSAFHQLPDVVPHRHTEKCKRSVDSGDPNANEVQKRSPHLHSIHEVKSYKKGSCNGSTDLREMLTDALFLAQALFTIMILI